MSQIRQDSVIDISDSDDEQAVSPPVQPQTRHFVAGNKGPNVSSWQAPVAPSGMVAAVPSPVKPATRGGLAVPSDGAPDHGATTTAKPLMKAVDPVNRTLSSDDGTANPLLSSSARSTNSAPRPQPRFIQHDTPSPPSATVPLPTQKDPAQGSPTHKRTSLPAAPDRGFILIPGRKKRKRQIRGYQPGLLGFNDDHDDSSNPVDLNPDLPTRKRARLSTDSAKELVHIRGLAALSLIDIGKGAPNTGPEVSQKENKVKGPRKKGQDKAAVPAKLKRIHLPPCEEPEKDDAVITPAQINDILRTVTSDNEADEARMDIGMDMSVDPPPRSRSPTPVRHPQIPQIPPLVTQEPVTSHGASQRTESTQAVINVLDFGLNLFWDEEDEEDDADFQRALQLDCEMHSSPIHPTVCAPSVIEPDAAVDFDPSPSRDYLSNLPNGGVPGVGGSWECHDLARHATEAVSFTREYLNGRSKKTSDVGEAKETPEKQVQDPFAPGVVDLHRQTIQGQLRVWAENPRAGISSDLAGELVVTREELAVRVAKRKLAESTAGVSRFHEKSDIEVLDLKSIQSFSEGALDEEDVVSESPEVEQQSTPEEQEQAAATSPSGDSASVSSRLSTTSGMFAIADLDMKAGDEGAGTNQGPSLFAEPQEPVLPQRAIPSGIQISITGSESARREPTVTSKRTRPTSRATQFQSGKKFTGRAIEDLERVVLKQLKLTPEAFAPHNPPVWERLAHLRPKKLYLSTDHIARWELEQEPEPDGMEDDES